MRVIAGITSIGLIMLIASCSTDSKIGNPKIIKATQSSNTKLQYLSFILTIPAVEPVEPVEPAESAPTINLPRISEADDFNSVADDIELSVVESASSPVSVVIPIAEPEILVEPLTTSVAQPENLPDSITRSVIEPEYVSEPEAVNVENTQIQPISSLHDNVPKWPLASIVRESGDLNFCEKIDRKLSSITFRSCLERNFDSSHRHTHHQHPIYYIDYPELDSRISLGRILLLGGVHGDELTSVSTVFMWMSTLNKHHTGMFTWRVAPLVNPDGFFLTTPTRTNANGVDLNRNLPTNNWDQLAEDYWKVYAKESERKFPGSHAGSEPETQWLVEEIERFDPDVIITVHAPYNLVDYDAINRKDAPRRLGILPGRSLGTFPGSLGRYAGEQKNIPVVTIELPHSSEMPAEIDIKHIWSDLIYWLRQNISNRESPNVAQQL